MMAYEAVMHEQEEPEEKPVQKAPDVSAPRPSITVVNASGDASAGERAAAALEAQGFNVNVINSSSTSPSSSAIVRDKDTADRIHAAGLDIPVTNKPNGNNDTVVIGQN